MTYGKTHTENHCDKCNTKVGKENLLRVPFLYLDRNDKSHKDMERNYRQYFVCKECKENGI